ncbi:hypothetical protein CYR40_08750 [Chimaeribacter arupi]|uniref:Uncharacterized protein n=1 Tax=Chimaeribacter arupi TaxID=2060066 RepID=A0A2N5EN20_9GAMM|nr:hypothetical protein CYR23_08480 [Chimaeribacter arupi]PLR47217.1 hypothetical protein CYR40_08750 [Chimaeribacter arupi]PLR49007.1 hypothetical protein CYR52_12465 [Chimaeribacter arupi]PLR49850.1 hypothetical protein CYR34_10885 [Chimaeribacter arupi]
MQESIRKMLRRLQEEVRDTSRMENESLSTEQTGGSGRLKECAPAGCRMTRQDERGTSDKDSRLG